MGYRAFFINHKTLNQPPLHSISLISNGFLRSHTMAPMLRPSRQRRISYRNPLILKAPGLIEKLPIFFLTC